MSITEDIQEECGLSGIVEMHIHATPDSPKGWWGTDKLSLATQFRDAGYGAVLFNGNNWPTHNEAFLLSRQVRGIHIFGGMTINLNYGDRINLTAVERCLQDDAGEYCRCIWLPTMDSDFDKRMAGGKGIPVLDGKGGVLPEVLDLMAVCRDAGIILGTGHSGPDAAPILADAARKIGLRKLVITQSTLSPRALSDAQARTCIDRGAYLEHVMLTAFKGHDHTIIPKHQAHEYTSLSTLARCIEHAPDRQFVATDLNQALNPHPVSAMRLMLVSLRKAGLSASDIRNVTSIVPKHLLGIGE